MKKFLMSVGAVGLTAGTAFATETTTSLPDIGVDVGSFISTGITSMGAVVAVAVGGYCAFLIVKKALRWVGKALS